MQQPSKLLLITINTYPLEKFHIKKLNLSKRVRKILIHLACLLGFGPEIWLCNQRKHFLRDERKLFYSLWLNILGQWVLFNYLFCAVVQLRISASQMVQPFKFNFIAAIEIFIFLTVYIWLGLYLYGFMVCLFQLHWRLPGISWMIRSPLIKRSAITLGFISQLVLIVIIGSCIHAASLTRSQPEKAKVYLLYQTEIPTFLGVIPTPGWIVNLGFLPIAEQATARWGEGAVSVQPMSTATIAEALQNGKLVFFASHGGGLAGSIAISTMPYDIFYASVVPLYGGTSEDLQLVYITACGGGSRQQEWDQYLAPARVIAYDRTSFEIEHLLWLWFDGPNTVKELK